MEEGCQNSPNGHPTSGPSPLLSFWGLEVLSCRQKQPQICPLALRLELSLSFCLCSLTFNSQAKACLSPGSCAC